MKILPFKIPKTSQESFHLQVDNQKYFYDYLHQHPEIQITLVFKGEGKLIVGDYIGEFKPSDIYFIGSNLPHVFRNDTNYYNPDYQQRAHSISIFFEWKSFGEKFLQLPEAKTLYEFSKNSEKGLQIKDPTRSEIAELMKKMFEVSEMDRLITLLNILNVLSNSIDVKPLASSGIYSDFNEIDGKRLDAIYRFTMNEFHRKINLEEVSAIANMTVNSFCRYFKRRTRKSYIDFLNEIRISQACKLLQQYDFSISQVCFEVGFSNLSNFNRKFKELNDCTPTEFRKQQIINIQQG